MIIYILLSIIIVLLIANLTMTIIVLFGYGEILPVIKKALHMKCELIKQQMKIVEKRINNKQ